MIGLHATYTWEPTTRWAIGLSGIIQSLGETVHWFTPTATTGIHDDWDQKVAVCPDDNCMSHVGKCRRVISLNPSKAFLRSCHKVNVVPWILGHSVAELFRLPCPIAKLICPTVLTRKLFAKDNSDVAYVPCEPWLPTMPMRTPEQERRVMVVVPRDVSEQYATRMFYAWHFLLHHARGITVTFLHNRRWPYGASRALDDLQLAYPKRILVYRKTTYKQDLQLLGNHDVLFYPYSADELHLPVVEALLSGTPVVTFSSPRFVELFESEGSVRLCHARQKKTEIHGQTRIQPTLEQLFRAAATAAQADQLVSSESNLKERRQNARQAWARLLDIPGT